MCRPSPSPPFVIPLTVGAICYLVVHLWPLLHPGKEHLPSRFTTLLAQRTATYSRPSFSDLSVLLGILSNCAEDEWLSISELVVRIILHMCSFFRCLSPFVSSYSSFRCKTLVRPYRTTWVEQVANLGLRTHHACLKRHR